MRRQQIQWSNSMLKVLLFTEATSRGLLLQLEVVDSAEFRSKLHGKRAPVHPLEASVQAQ